MGNKGIQALIKMEGELGKQAGDFDPGIEGSKFLRPTTQGALKLQNLGDIIRNLTATGRAVTTRQEGIVTGIESAARAEQESFQRSQQEIQTLQGLLTSRIQGRQEQRAQELFPGQLTTQQLQQQQLQQQISGTVPFTKGELIQIGEKFADPQAVMDFIQNRKSAGTANRPQRNNNPLNLKIGGLSQQFVDQGLATIESKAVQDGGNFLKFNSPEDGFAAAQSVLFMTDFYGNRRVDNAMRT